MFVRWLGAFGKGGSLVDSINWELTQATRQVACECLKNGRSNLTSRANIGLVIDEKQSTFIQGWLFDAWTVEQENGILKPAPGARRCIKQNRYKDINRFKKCANRLDGSEGHTEAIFDNVTFKALAVKRSANKQTKQLARQLANQFGLKFITV